MLLKKGRIIIIEAVLMNKKKVEKELTYIYTRISFPAKIKDGLYITFPNLNLYSHLFFYKSKQDLWYESD